jgi:hypothetical protein
MRVDSVHDLHIDPAQVWAGSAHDDPVSEGAFSLGHNTGPHEDGFGANRFLVDTHGHSNYWDQGSQSLNNQALIIIGDDGAVTPQPPQPWHNPLAPPDPGGGYEPWHNPFAPGGR